MHTNIHIYICIYESRHFKTVENHTGNKTVTLEKNRLVKQYGHPAHGENTHKQACGEVQVALVARWPAAGREQCYAGVAEASDFASQVRLPGPKCDGIPLFWVPVPRQLSYFLPLC